MKLLLTDEEIEVIFNLAKRTPTAPVDCYVCRGRLIKAQLKKVADEWNRTSFYLTTDDSRIPCMGIEGVNKFWQALLKEVEDA